MTNVAFNISERNESGKAVRRNGEIPCVLYGEHLEKPISAKLTRKEVDKLLTCAKSSILSLNLNGTTENCVVKELQKDNYGKVIHIDFQYVNKDENIKLKIPVVYTGESLLESKKLFLETFLSEVELYGEADKFPENIEFDVSALNYSDTVVAGDLNLVEGMKLVTNSDVVLTKVDGNNAVEEEEEDAE